MTGGSRPASSQLTTIAISGMPTRIHSRLVTGMLPSADSWSSWLVLKKPIASLQMSVDGATQHPKSAYARKLEKPTRVLRSFALFKF